MSAAARTVTTAAGPLRVVPLSEASRRALAEFFPELRPLEHEGRAMLGLVMAGAGHRMHGLRTGYGWYEGERAMVARRAALFGRMRLPRALKAFRDSGFDGVLLPAACVLDGGAGAVQEGELLFVHARAPMTGEWASDPAESWERTIGRHSTGALLAFVAAVATAWKEGGVAQRTLTDLEPCAADFAPVRWLADVALVDGRLVLVRTVLEDADPLLGALVEAGFDQVEWEPCGFVLPAPPEPDGPPA